MGGKSKFLSLSSPPWPITLHSPATSLTPTTSTHQLARQRPTLISPHHHSPNCSSPPSPPSLNSSLTTLHTPQLARQREEEQADRTRERENQQSALQHLIDETTTTMTKMEEEYKQQTESLVCTLLSFGIVICCGDTNHNTCVLHGWFLEPCPVYDR